MKLGYSITADARDITNEFLSMDITWGLDHRTMQAIPPSGALAVARASDLNRQGVIRNGIELSNPDVGGVLFRADTGIQRRDSGSLAQPNAFDLQTGTRLSMAVRDRRVEWHRPQAGVSNRQGVDFRTQPIQQREWARQLLQAAYPEHAVDVSRCPATGLEWHPPRTAGWHLQDTPRIMYSWFGWPVFSSGTGGLSMTPGDLVGRDAAITTTQDDLRITGMSGGVVEAGLFTGLQLDWQYLYRDAFSDVVVNDEPVEIPEIQPLYRNIGAELLHGAREAVIPGVPPGSPTPTDWDAAAYGLNSALPNLQMQGWSPSGDYGAAITTRAQHRRVVTLGIPGVQPTPEAYATLRRLIAPGSIHALNIDGRPYDQWAGYCTTAVVNFSWDYNRMPTWIISFVSLSGRIPGRDRWTLGETPLPAPLA